MEPRPAQQARGSRLACALFAALLASLSARIGRGAEDEPDAPPPPVERTTGPVIVEAIRPAEIPEDPSSFTTVIETERFEGEAKSVDALLDDVPGVRIRRFGGPGQPSEVTIRGSSGSQVVVLLDGVRLSSAQTGAADLSTIPADLVERIEVSRGGGSVQTGSDAIGGVVNIITKRPSARWQSTAAGARASFHTWQASASQTGRLGDTEFSLGYDFFKTRGDWDFKPVEVRVDGMVRPEDTDSAERINNQTERHSALARFGRDLGDHFRVEFNDQFLYDSSGRPGLDRGEGSELRGQSRTGHLRRTRNVAQLRFVGSELSAAKLDGDLRLFHRYERTDFHDKMPPGGREEIDDDDRTHALGARLGLEREIALGPSVHAASLGVEFRQDRLHAREQANRNRDTVGVFLQDEVSFFERKLRLIPGGRFDRTDGLGHEWVPRIGAVLQPLPWIRLQGNAERSYRVPNFDELFINDGVLRGNPNLDAEEAWNYDGGLKLGFSRFGLLDEFQVEAVGFYNDIENSIVYQNIGNNVVAATNTGDASIKGVELSGSVRLFGWFRFSGNWTHLDTEQDRTGNPIPGRPEDETVFRAELSPPSGWFKLVGERHFTDNIPVNERGSENVSSRTTYDASLSIDLALIDRIGPRLPLRKLVLSVVGTNITDRSVRDAVGYPQPGRVLTFRIEASR